MFTKSRGVFTQNQIRKVWQGLTRTDKLNVSEPERLGSLLGGGLLTLYGLGQRSPTIIGFILAGGYLVYRGLTGHCPAYETLQINTANQPPLRFDDEYNEQPETTIDVDDVLDEAVWQTFPASDPSGSW